MPLNRRNIALAGFMGTGKTTIGRMVADRIGLSFIDTDAEVEAAAGRTIAEIFAVDGEGAFRRLEASVCLHAASRGGQVIALGGGALLEPHSCAALQVSGLIICLTAPLEVIIERVAGDDARPLAHSRAGLERLFADRALHYEHLPHHIHTAGKAPSAVVEEVIALWRSGK